MEHVCSCKHSANFLQDCAHILTSEKEWPLIMLLQVTWVFPDDAGRHAALCLALDDFPANYSNTVLGQPRGLAAQESATQLILARSSLWQGQIRPEVMILCDKFYFRRSTV